MRPYSELLSLKARSANVIWWFPTVERDCSEHVGPSFDGQRWTAEDCISKAEFRVLVRSVNPQCAGLPVLLRRLLSSVRARSMELGPSCRRYRLPARPE